ncbi:MAG: hypothetical protein IPK07_23955 [Deltaproteobacteria bacterium]|jgi:hypothetical protein|nr:hypothetical protein [Deltaproteobacteria bacterium]
MNAAHVHLLVNHLPIVGATLAVPLLVLAAMMPRQRGLVVSVAVILTLAAGGAGLALVSGDAAGEIVESLPGVREGDIETHEERAEVAMVFAVVAALASLAAAGLEIDRGTPAPRLAVLALLGLALANVGAMTWTGASGGVIRHTEIRGGAGAAASSAPDAAVQGDADRQGRGRGHGGDHDDD